jgi:hypothetical protein
VVLRAALPWAAACALAGALAVSALTARPQDFPVWVGYEEVDRYGDEPTMSTHIFRAASWDQWRDVVVGNDLAEPWQWSEDFEYGPADQFDAATGFVVGQIRPDGRWEVVDSQPPGDGWVPGPLFSPGVTPVAGDRQAVGRPAGAARLVHVATALGLSAHDLAAHAYQDGWECPTTPGDPFCDDGHVVAVTDVVYHRSTRLPLAVQVWEDGLMVQSLTVRQLQFGTPYDVPEPIR